MSYATSVIKSIQQGTATFTGVNVTSGTATITSVSTSKSTVIHLGPSIITSLGSRVELTNSTTVTLITEGNNGAGNTFKSGFVVVEYY